MLNDITPLILTFNEAPNIERTLGQLSWAGNVVIVDSASTDHTSRLASARHPGVRWFERRFTTHAEQWNFGLEETAITTEWVLALDADFVLSDALIEELKQLRPESGVGGYQASFTYCIDGRPLRGAVYPPVTVLYRRAGARYVQDGHTQRVRVDGAVRPLTSTIFHDDRKPLGHWLMSQSRYMKLEADKLLNTPSAALRFVDRVRRMIVVAPAAMFVYCLIGRGGIFDGWPGLYYAMQRATAELILSLNLLERVIARRKS
jgi:glycosyltransferase involved in cell wall biosynthesis